MCGIYLELQTQCSVLSCAGAGRLRCLHCIKCNAGTCWGLNSGYFSPYPMLRPSHIYRVTCIYAPDFASANLSSPYKEGGCDSAYATWLISPLPGPICFSVHPPLPPNTPSSLPFCPPATFSHPCAGFLGPARTLCHRGRICNLEGTCVLLRASMTPK